MINWYLQDEVQFARIINMLVQAEWSNVPLSKVSPIDGRGGDGGVDIEVKLNGSKFIVYQLKFFREGISGGNYQRRTQIKKSWDKVKNRNDFVEWVLVLPTELTPPEKLFIQQLENPNQVKISFWGKSDIDFRLTKNPQIARAAELTPSHLREAELYKTERAELLNPVPDLVARVQGLGAMGEIADPNYSYAFEYSKGKVSVSATPQPGTPAPTVTVKLRVQNESAQHQNIAKVIGFGLDDELTLDKEVLSLAMEGPFEVPAGSEAILKIHPPTIIPTDLSGQQVSLELEDDNEQRISSFSGITEHLGKGPQGFSWRLKFFHCLSLTMFSSISNDTLIPAPIIDFNPVGCGPHELSEALKLLVDLSGTSKIAINISGKRVITWQASGFSMGSEEDVGELIRFCEDLINIESRLKMKFTFVEEITPSDVSMASTIRLLLEGKRCIVPIFGRLDFNTDSAGASAIKAAYAEDCEHLYLPARSFVLPLLGTNINIGDVDLWNPKVKIDFTEATGDSNVVHVTCTAPEGQCFIFTPLTSENLASQNSEIYWPVPRLKMPDWVLEFSDDYLVDSGEIK